MTGRRTAAALALDLASVLLFVLIGRASHHHRDDVEGVASTTWPFLAGLGAGWMVLAARGRDTAPGAGRSPLSAQSGALVCASTVLVGMVLRVLTGQGTAPAFVGVSTGFLGGCTLGGRALVRRRAGRTGPQARPR